MKKHGKKYNNAAKLFDRNKVYSIKEAVELVKKTAYTKFNGTVDEVNMEKGKVRVMVSFFGRETPVELDLLQVEKV